jgi:hypothetical protein
MELLFNRMKTLTRLFGEETDNWGCGDQGPQTLRVSENYYDLDHLPNSYGAVDPGNGDSEHHGRVSSHPPRSGLGHSGNTVSQRPPPRLTDY